MIMNNFIAMKSIEEKYKQQKLDKDMLLELHSLLMENTVSKEEVGRFRTDEDDIIVSDSRDGTIYHTPPKTSFLQDEIERFVKFANDELGEGPFVHPVIKAIMLHFWLGYLHPFTNGNGRLARLIFHWYLLKKDYWAISYLPISTVIKRARIQYAMAYVYSEQDDYDLTYFVDYNIRRIKYAVADFEEYMKKKSKENLMMRKRCQEQHGLNERQIQLLQYLYKNPEGSTSWKVHMNINNVSKLTAIKDLKSLEKTGFIKSKKTGRNVNYYATDRIEELFS